MASKTTHVQSVKRFPATRCTAFVQHRPVASSWVAICRLRLTRQENHLSHYMYKNIVFLPSIPLSGMSLQNSPPPFSFDAIHRHGAGGAKPLSPYISTVTVQPDS